MAPLLSSEKDPHLFNLSRTSCVGVRSVQSGRSQGLLKKRQVIEQTREVLVCCHGALNQIRDRVLMQPLSVLFFSLAERHLE